MMELILSTYQYGAFDCLLLLCHARVSELIFTQTIECRFTLKLARNKMITYSQLISTDKYSQHSSIIWPVWLNAWVLVYKWLWIQAPLVSLKTGPAWNFPEPRVPICSRCLNPPPFQNQYPLILLYLFSQSPDQDQQNASKHCHLFTTLVL